MSDRIYAITRRLSKITKGKWEIKESKSAYTITSGNKDIVTFSNEKDPDVNLIVKAPSDIQYLLNEIERLKAFNRQAYSEGYAMAKFDCAMNLSNNELDNEALIENWVTSSNKINNALSKQNVSINTKDPI